MSNDDEYKKFVDCKIDCNSDSDTDSDNNSDISNDSDKQSAENDIVVDFNSKLLEKLIRTKLKSSIRKAIDVTIKKRKAKLLNISKKVIEETNDDSFDEDEYNDLNISYLSKEDAKKVMKSNKEIKLINNKKIPDKIKILLSDMPAKTKAIIIKKIELLETLENSSSEYKKLNDWVNSILKIPFGKYTPLPVSLNDGYQEIGSFLTLLKKKLDDTIYGQNHVKETLIELVAKWITNPPSKGHAIAIVGFKGTGKTSLIRGLSNALDRPFCSFSLAGMSDESYLSGFSHTYEGSDYGKITRMLIEAGKMNPIIFMDEVDKIDTSKHGIAVMNKLIEITDFSQNYEYEDLYFNDVKIDLSQCLFIFSLNDINAIDPILRDRLEVIKVKGFSNNEKKIICKNYLIPRELKDININKNDIIFPDHVICHIINKIQEHTTQKEEGVRRLKNSINIIIRKLNVLQYMNDDENSKTLSYFKCIKFPITLTNKLVDHLLILDTPDINLSMYM